MPLAPQAPTPETVMPAVSSSRTPGAITGGVSIDVTAISNSKIEVMEGQTNSGLISKINLAGMMNKLTNSGPLGTYFGEIGFRGYLAEIGALLPPVLSKAMMLRRTFRLSPYAAPLRHEC